MPRNYSASLQRTINSTGAAETPAVLLEINHSALSAPVRINNSGADITHQGNVYTALAFRITLPDDLGRGLPSARLAVDNVGKDLTQWLEASGGGQGATVTITQVLPSAPDVVEFSITMDLTNVRMSMFEVTGDLGFSDLLNLPSVPLTYRPDTAPGLF